MLRAAFSERRSSSLIGDADLPFPSTLHLYKFIYDFLLLFPLPFHAFHAFQGFGFYSGNDNSSRAQTPSAFHHTRPQYSGPHISLPDLNVGRLTMPNISPHHSFTPYPNSRHSRSSSNANYPRSTSPNASVVSTAPSPSGSARRHTQSRPPVSYGSAEYISAPSFTSTFNDVPMGRKRNCLKIKQKQEICQYHAEHPYERQEDIAEMWGVDRSTVSKILKNKGELLASREDNLHFSKLRKPKDEDIEGFMSIWLEKCRDSGTHITDAMIRSKACEIARGLDIGADKFKASAGWVANYKRRIGIKKGIWAGRPEPAIWDDTGTRDEVADSLLPLVSETLALAIRKKEMEEAEKRERELELENDVDMGDEIPDYLSREPPPFLIAEPGSWPSPLDGLAFANSELMNASTITKLNKGAKEVPPDPKPVAELQYHDEVALTTWAANGESTTSSEVIDSPPVNPQEASNAITTVWRFIEAQKPGFLSEQERNIVTDVKDHILLSVVQSQPRRRPVPIRL